LNYLLLLTLLLTDGGLTIEIKGGEVYLFEIKKIPRV